MNILITAGGTSEKIDDVRKITNHSSGRLGSLIADAFLSDPTISVTYLHSSQALLPNIISPQLRLVAVDSVDELFEGLTKELENTTYDAVIHSMAVSDYKLKTALTEEQLIQQLVEQLKDSSTVTEEKLNQAFQKITTTASSTDKKISSKSDGLILWLTQTPKVISIIKEKQPNTILVGFKLLVGVSEQELLKVGFNLLQKKPRRLCFG